MDEWIKVSRRCEPLFQAFKAAEREAMDAWNEHARFLQRSGVAPGRMVTLNAAQVQERADLNARIERATKAWTSAALAWGLCSGGIRVDPMYWPAEND